MLIDSYARMRDAIAHLIEFHGYRRLAFIHGPETHFYAQERYRAYVDALEAYDIPLDPNLVTEYGAFASTAGAEGIRLLLDERNLQPKVDFEAVVTASDLPALGALDELQTRGIRVPEDVALMGFNDSRDGQFVTPPLTSVRLPFQEQGRKAVELLLAQMAGEQVPEQVVLPASLRVRQSCGCMLPSVVQAAAKLSQEEVEAHLPAGQTLEAAFAACRDATIDEFVQEMSIDLQPGDGIVLYSDGITEAQNEAKEFYKLERLCQVASEHWDGTAEDVKNAVVADVKAFIGKQKVYDDITLVVVKQR